MSEEQGTPQENPLDPIKSDISASEPVQTPPATPPPFQQFPPFGQFGNGMGQQNLPNATISLVLGILSIPACCCYGLGLVFGIVAWVLAGKDIKQYNLNPAAYSLSSLKNTRAGKNLWNYRRYFECAIYYSFGRNDYRFWMGGITRSGNNERIIERKRTSVNFYSG